MSKYEYDTLGERFCAGDFVLINGRGPLRVVDVSLVLGAVRVAIPGVGRSGWIDRARVTRAIPEATP